MAVTGGASDGAREVMLRRSRALRRQLRSRVEAFSILQQLGGGVYGRLGLVNLLLLPSLHRMDVRSGPVRGGDLLTLHGCGITGRCRCLLHHISGIHSGLIVADTLIHDLLAGASMRRS
jgi:hypothetical protein